MESILLTTTTLRARLLRWLQYSTVLQFIRIDQLLDLGWKFLLLCIFGQLASHCCPQVSISLRLWRVGTQLAINERLYLRIAANVLIIGANGQVNQVVVQARADSL